MATKSLNEVEVGDVVVAMGDKRFDGPLKVRTVQRFCAKSRRMVAPGSMGGSVVCVVLDGGRFWSMQPGQAEATTIEVAR